MLFRRIKISRTRGLLFIIVLALLLTLIYLKSYQKVVTDGTNLEDKRCLVMGPLHDKKMVLFTKWISDPDNFTNQEYQDLHGLVMETINFYKPWLDKENLYLQRKDFQILVDTKIKDKLSAMANKYNADYLSNMAILAYLEEPANKETLDNLKTAFDRTTKAEDWLLEKEKAADNYSDIRGSFIHTPMPKCDTEDNYPSIPVEKEDRAS